MRFLGTVARKGAKKSELMMKVNTWLPAVRYVDPKLLVESTAVVDIIPFSSVDAKSLTFKRQEFDRDGYESRFDRFGHTSAEISMNLGSPISSDMRDIIQEMTGISSKQFSQLDALEAYVSWFPKQGRDSTLLETGIKMTADEEGLLLKPYEDDAFEKFPAVKARVLNLFAKQYEAISRSASEDIAMYGRLSENYTSFILPVEKDKALLQAVFDMMSAEIQGNKLILGSVKPEATYFGIDILRECSLLLSHGEAFDDKLPSPEHVCTTAVLRLIRSSIGKDKYIQLVNEAAKENPQLPHDFMCVELINTLLDKITQSPERALTGSPTFSR